MLHAPVNTLAIDCDNPRTRLCIMETQVGTQCWRCLGRAGLSCILRTGRARKAPRLRAVRLQLSLRDRGCVKTQTMKLCDDCPGREYSGIPQISDVSTAGKRA